MEIITNCDDSYHRLHKKTGRNRDGGDILIKVEQHRSKPSRVVIHDKAEGMTSFDMKEKLGRMGKRTSEQGDRGFMARGIKDCTSLGEITVESICDGKYYVCELTTDGKIRLHDPKPVTADVKSRLQIEKKNGTVVTLQCKNTTKVPRADTLAKNLPLHYALRDVLAQQSDAKVIVRGGRGVATKRIYSPSLYLGTPVFHDKFALDGYPKSECDLQIWKHESALKHADPRLRKSGIIIKGERAIYQCSLFRYEHDEHAKHYAGRLTCKYIDYLMDEFDENPDKDLAHNPMLVVDPSRKQGLNTSHPFTKVLTKKVESVLDDLLESDRKEKEQEQGSIASEETRKRLSKLARMADRIWKEEFEDDDLSDAEGRAIEILEDKGIYIMPPKFNVGVGAEKILTVYVKESHYDRKRKVRVQSSDEKVLKLVRTFSHNELRPHRKKSDVVYGTIKVAGLALGKSTVTVRPKKDIAATAVGDVVETPSPGDDHDFRKGSSLEFERSNYTLLEGKTKALKIFAKKSMIGKSSIVHVSSNKHDEVVVLDGNKCKLEATPHNYASGTVRVEGRGVTQLKKPATVTAKINDIVAKTRVRVVEKKSSAGRFDFELTAENLGDFRARWADIEDKPNLLKISAVHPSIQGYFGEPPEFLGQHDPAGLALIAELVTENFCTRLLQEEMKHRPGGFKYGNDQPQEVLIKIVNDLQKRIHEFSVQAHKIMRRS